MAAAGGRVVRRLDPGGLQVRAERREEWGHPLEHLLRQGAAAEEGTQVTGERLAAGRVGRLLCEALNRQVGGVIEATCE